MTLHERIAADAARAAKGGDGVRRDTLRFLLSSLHNREIEKRGRGGPPAGGGLTDEDVAGVVEREVKKRKEAVEFFEEGDRPVQAAKERAELAILESYLPAALPDAEVERLVDEALRATGAESVKDIGRVMGAFRGLVEATTKGARVDAAAVSAKIKARLLAHPAGGS